MPAVAAIPAAAQAVALVAALMVTLLTGCLPVYTFQFPSDTVQATNAKTLEARLGGVLEARGFQRIGFTDRAAGDVGCNSGKTDHITFEKAWGGTGFLSNHRWVWVHEFSCERVRYVVIVSSRGADREAAEVRDAVLSEFGAEISKGDLQVDTSFRIALE